MAYQLLEAGTFLHVGCGSKRSDSTPFAGLGWQETRLDINPDVAPDVIGTITDLSAISSQSFDALFSSHNIEHLYPHEVPLALAEFRRVLKPSGFALITCPDLRSVCALVADGMLIQPAYNSPAGPIAPLDIIYGHRPSLQAGNLFMAHRCGFTEATLTTSLQGAGFLQVASLTRSSAFDLWALATCEVWPDLALRTMAARLLPVTAA